MEHELSRPVRKQDVHLDYLPTQYLCEFIKSLGFDGVEYKSAMNSNGYNLAIFTDKKLDCVDAIFHRVTNLQYDWEPK
ncbi:RES family NAD+ phosphorylase [Pedobacter gandavensis]|uniref:RES family NAD+ phosphorylase n=1 Tax=Pedobacter gandavensis TaxID=2679963 RepID=UPI00397751DE